MKNMLAILTTALEVLGLGLIVAGIWMLSVPIAFMAAGVGLVAISYLVTRGGHT